jgi:hypothetical protein
MTVGHEGTHLAVAGKPEGMPVGFLGSRGFIPSHLRSGIRRVGRVIPPGAMLELLRISPR